MGKITFYCNICGGPLSSWDLRQASTAQEGEDIDLCYDDTCDCDAPPDPPDTEAGDQSSTPRKHESYCASRRGYNGELLAESDILWLDRVRVLRARITPSVEDGEPWYITEIGDNYDPWYGLTVPGEHADRDDTRLWPNVDGFFLHDSCWQMLQLVQRQTGSSSQTVDLRRLYLTMQTQLQREMDVAIDWQDSRVYGGTEEFQGQEWEPYPGYEWLVADPIKPIDVSELVSAALSPYLGSANAIVSAGAIKWSGIDPFSRLPKEVHDMIVQMLPSPSVINLVVASLAFRASTRDLPHSFWRSRLEYYDTPWIDRSSLPQLSQNGQVNYKDLIWLFKYVTTQPEDGMNEPEESCLSLMNRRRIWTCCEAILAKVEEQSVPAGPVSAEMQNLANIRLASLSSRGSDMRNSEVYFTPTFLDPPAVRGVTVYFGPKTWIVGIEWHLEGETGRLFGRRTLPQQSVTIPSDITISGIILSLGPRARDAEVWGFGILTGKDPVEPRIRLGRWTESDVVHVFRPGQNQPGVIVGIAGQYNDDRIFRFGIITVDPGYRKYTPVASLERSLDIYTRWVYPWLPLPGQSVDMRYGIDNFPSADGSPFDPPILETPAVYVRLDRQLASVTAYFPAGEKKEFGGLYFQFADGSDQLVGSAQNHESVQGKDHTVYFDVAGQETIRGIVWYFDSNINRRTPSRLHGLQFHTSLQQVKGLGFLDAYNEYYKREKQIWPEERIVGLHVGIAPPFIESLGMVLA